jgi:predicted nucleotidyltransferase
MDLIMVEYTQTVRQLVDRVVETVHPLRIILFGSGARKEADTESDIDLLVVMPDGTHRRQTSQTLYRQVRGIGVPFDILVATPRDLEMHKDNVGLVYRNVLQEGVEVYVS